MREFCCLFCRRPSRTGPGTGATGTARRRPPPRRNDRRCSSRTGLPEDRANGGRSGRRRRPERPAGGGQARCGRGRGCGGRGAGGRAAPAGGCRRRPFRGQREDKSGERRERRRMAPMGSGMGIARLPSPSSSMAWGRLPPLRLSPACHRRTSSSPASPRRLPPQPVGRPAHPES
ncbi:hypothetical protein DAI22_01g052100 [Oryza sativa Japonica Group]|nr:hypothetical protein DAI22_01g052100 [Oryza sativa Japonica Group]